MRLRGLGRWLAAAALLGVVHVPVASAQERFDIVLAGGRVMDPESGLDAVRDVGIRGGRIAAISSTPLQGRERVEVGGLVVAPGFIDLHAHGQNPESNRYQARDGVTAALELEGGAYPVAPFYEAREGRTLIHFGATVDHGGLRAAVMRGRSKAQGGDAGSPERTRYEAATDAELREIVRRLHEGLDAGALGIGYGIQYVPGARREEIYRAFEVAAQEGVTNFVHFRYAGLVEPGSSIEAMHEMIGDSASTGASVHVVHIGSSGLRQVPILLEMVAGAQRHGIDVTTEVYPYTAASTDIRAAIFDPGWRERLGGDYGDIEWVATGERLDAESFAAHRKTGGPIIAHIIPEEMVKAAVAHPLVMIASDGVPFTNGRAHPRGQGTFARVLGRYVREQRALTLMEALRKMSLMPARRLEAAVPQMRSKGRIRVGADADLTVFDADRVIDRATFAEPAQYSEGMVHVLVEGTFVVRDESLVEGVAPGRAIRRPLAERASSGAR